MEKGWIRLTREIMTGVFESVLSLGLIQHLGKSMTRSQAWQTDMRTRAVKQ